MAFTDEQLRQITKNRRDALPPPEPKARFDETEIPCCICGKPLTIARIPKYGLEAFKNIAHAACVAAQKEAEAAEAKRLAVAAVLDSPELALDRCGVPPHWQRSMFDTCGAIPVDKLQASRAWSEKPSGMFFLSGISGCGKTTLACAMLRHVLTRGVLPPGSCRFVTEYAYLDGVKASFGETTVPMRDRPKDDAAKVELLIYDDLGVSTSDWSKGEVVSMLTYRHAQELPTIITSNFSPGEISRRIDPRLMSRIAESDHCYGLPAADLRKRNGKESQ